MGLAPYVKFDRPMGMEVRGLTQGLPTWSLVVPPPIVEARGEMTSIMLAHGLLHVSVKTSLQSLVRIIQTSRMTMMSETACNLDLPRHPLLFHPQPVTCAMDHQEILSLMSSKGDLSGGEINEMPTICIVYLFQSGSLVDLLVRDSFEHHGHLF